ncbi:MAG: hypothetical protein M3M85_01715 [bacterium]|nr:hypothetical protein [bacterium]
MKTLLKKIIPYFLFLIILVGAGFLSGGKNVSADPGKSPPEGICKNGTDSLGSDVTEAKCAELAGKLGPDKAQFDTTWTPDDPPNTLVVVKPGTAESGKPQEETTAFEDAIKEKACLTWRPNGGCILRFMYYGVYLPATGLLWVSAHIFNYLIIITLGSDMFTKSAFIPAAWGIVRDLANIFFILILLYTAFELILGMAHDAKKTIVKVVLAALLINFSMFFTGIVIDSSNILALVFYNKMDVQAEGRPYNPVGHRDDTGQKDVSGGLAKKFNPTALMTQGFFDKAKEQPIPGTSGLIKKSNEVPFGILYMTIIISVAVMLLAAYAFLVVSFAFLGRLIELWLLLIASPFAFMSSTIHGLEGLKDWGWKAWLHRLITTAFMAPAFMFFLYFIFLLISSEGFFENLYRRDANESLIQKILLFIIPTVTILFLLLKSVKLAKAGAGQFGETVTKWGEKVGGLVGGLALGAATGGAAIAGRATAGRLAAKMGSSQKVREWGFGGEAIRGALKGVSGASFDARGASKTLAKASAGKAKTGGWDQTRKDQVEKRIKRAHELEVSEDDPLQQNINNLEMSKQELLRQAEHDIKMLETRDKVFTKRQSDARARQQSIKAELENIPKNKSGKGLTPADETNRVRVQAELDQAIKDYRVAADAVKDINAHRKAIKDGAKYEVKTEAGELHGRAKGTTVDYGSGIYNRTISVAGVAGPVSINRLEDDLIPDAEHDKHAEDRRRKIKYTETLQGWPNKAINMIITGGEYSLNAGTREAVHKIIMDAKVETKKDH